MEYDKRTEVGKSSDASSSPKISAALPDFPANSISSTDADQLVAHLFRHQGARLVATLTRVLGPSHLGLAEDVVQDALIKALQQWPFRGIPENPAAWLTLVARNRALDLLRRDASLAGKVSELEQVLPQTAATPQSEIDDQLALILMCCHPALSDEWQIALTLKSVCGFSTAEIARAFLTEEPTIAQRLVRAKRRLREKKIAFALPEDAEFAGRLAAVMRVIYLVFNEGYGATRGDDLVRPDLCEEAIRLGTLLITHERGRVPEVHALLALMMLQAARLPARTQSDGTIALLANQDRTLWDQRLIASGFRHLGLSADGDRVTAYHLQAEIAAIHATAATDDDTDWKKIVALYEQLYELEPTPIVALNRAIALSRWQGPQAGIRVLEELAKVRALRSYHLLPAVLGELWKQMGDFGRAAKAYRKALNCDCTAPERRFLESQLEMIVDRA
jgi:RNA polymerase sigma-70 factor, ECF subfamily